MGNRKQPKRKKITLIQQYVLIQLKYKRMILKQSYSLSKATFDLKIKPSNVSNTYIVRMKLYNKVNPKVFVVKPKLKKRKRQMPPHTYDFKNGRICLFLPKEIDSSLYYDRIIPWISEWLFHYEIWLITGNWNGGGHAFGTIKESD